MASRWGGGAWSGPWEEREVAGASPGFSALENLRAWPIGPGALGIWGVSRRKLPLDLEDMKMGGEFSQRELSTFILTDPSGWILPDNLKLSSC